jgi:hypothetical protein
MADRLGQQTVFGRYLVERGYEQGVGGRSDAHGDRSLQPADHLVEIVERAEGDHAYGAGLRRFRIDVVEMLEAGRVFELPEQREAVPPPRIGFRPGLGRSGRREERHAESIEDRRQGRKDAGGDEGSTGQAQGNLRGTRPDDRPALRIMSDFGCHSTWTLGCAQSGHHFIGRWLGRSATGRTLPKRAAFGVNYQNLKRATFRVPADRGTAHRSSQPEPDKSRRVSPTSLRLRRQLHYCAFGAPWASAALGRGAGLSERLLR